MKPPKRHRKPINKADVSRKVKKKQKTTENARRSGSDHAVHQDVADHEVSQTFAAESSSTASAPIIGSNAERNTNMIVSDAREAPIWGGTTECKLPGTIHT